MKVLDLGGPTVTTYPLSDDGKYYKVNVVRRNYPPATAHATFTGTATQLGQNGPQLVLDGHDTTFTWWPTVSGDETAASTLTVDLGQYFLVGAIRPMYQPLGGNNTPTSEHIRIAAKPGLDGDWVDVFDGPPAAADSTISLTTPVSARFVEIAMTGHGANLMELFVYPSSQTSPPPTSADGYDLGSLAAATSIINENYQPLGTQWPQSWPQGAFRPKSAAWGPTGDAIGTVDLGAEYPISRLSLGFFWETSWTNGGRLDVGNAASTFTNVYDSGAGHWFLDDWHVGNDFTFPAQALRYIRTTDYFVGNEPSEQTLWSVLSFTDPPPHVGYFPLSEDGKYFEVNSARRPTNPTHATHVSVVYANGAVPWPGQDDPNVVLDGDDTGFIWASPSGTTPEGTATMTINLGEVQSLGAIRPWYTVPPVRSTIRVAALPTGPWTTVVNDEAVTDAAAIHSFAPHSAQYVELTMTGTTSAGFVYIPELQIFPSSAADPAPSTASGQLDLGYLTGISYTTQNDSMGVAGGAWFHFMNGVPGFYQKNAAQGGTTDGNVTIDLGQKYSLSELDFAFLSNGTWPNGAKIDLDDGTNTWPNVYDTGRGNPFGTGGIGPLKVSFTPHSARYVRLTGYYDATAVPGLLASIEAFGTNACVPSCGGKHCGDDRSDGCGGTCAVACGSGEAGCLSDNDCVGTDLHCVVRSPNPNAPRVCAATTCTSTCTAECTCSGGTACTADGQCASGFACTNGFCAVGINSCHNGVRDGNETGTDCGGSCVACVTGNVCNSDADCPSDQVCGEGNGACFGHARAERVCWKPACSLDNLAAGCGSEDSACGQNCACVNSCDTTGAGPDNCAAGEVCSKGMGSLFGAATPDVCLDPRCPSNDPALCGGPGSVCGSQCLCTANCSAATCDNPSDGCGGICPGVCQNGQHCTEDVHCPSGGVCLEDAQGVPTCRPAVCAFKTLTPPLCGSPGATCGDQCPTCTQRCENRQCGVDPNCGQSCGTCAAGAFCDANGQCVTPNVPQKLKIPDGNGGVRDLDDLLPSTTSNVGALKGQFAVSDEGSPQYTVPIEVPPGRAGMEPALSLNYSGSHLNQDEGVGWHLEGLSKITRCPHLFALDGYASAVRNDKNDLFCIDGKRIELYSGIYGHDGAEYRTLIDSFAKIISHKDPVGIHVDSNHVVSPVLAEDEGPDWFQVWTKDGRILTYGKTQDSLMFGRNGIRFAWLLNKVEDRSQNTILVQYNSLYANLPNALKQGLPNVVQPRMISYTGHGDSAGNRSVRFSYEGRSDNQLSFFQGGVPYATYQRLKQISTYVNDTPVKSYKVQYGSGGGPESDRGHLRMRRWRRLAWFQ